MYFSLLLFFLVWFQALTQHVVTATNSGGSTTCSITITVNDYAPSLLVYATGLTYMRSFAIAPNSPSNSGGSITAYSITPALPTGLVISTTSGQISGTPSVITSRITYTVTGTNSGGTTFASFNFQVVDIPPSVNAYSVPIAVYIIGYVVTTNTPVNTGGPIDTATISPALPPGLLLSSAGNIYGTPSVTISAATYTATLSNSGGTDTVTVVIEVRLEDPPLLGISNSEWVLTKGVAMSSYNFTTSGGNVLTWTCSPSLPAGLSLSSSGSVTGSPSSLQTRTSYTVGGSNSGGSDFIVVYITVVDVPPSNVRYTVLNPSYTISVPIAFNYPSYDGGSVTAWSASSLPPGLSLGATSGIISGTPTVMAVATSFVVTATNSGGSATVTLTIAIVDRAPALSYSVSSLSQTVNTLLTALNPTNSGGAIVSCVVSPTLPTGLSLSSTCVLSGTPTELTVSKTYTITGTNTGGSSSAALVIVVVDVPPCCLSYTLNSQGYITGTQNVAISPNVPAVGGGAVVSFTVNPSLPEGLVLDSASGRISGTPTVLWLTADLFIVTASNSGGAATATVKFQILDAAITGFTYQQLTATYTRDSEIFPNSPICFGGPCKTFQVSPTLPAGLGLGALDGVIAGTPALSAVTSAAQAYVITAGNTFGTVNLTIYIWVVDIPPQNLVYSTPIVWVFSSNDECPVEITEVTPYMPSVSGGSVVLFSISPDLEALTGVQLDNGSGLLHGNATLLMPPTLFTVTATNTGGSASFDVLISVIDHPPSRLMYSDMYSVYTMGVDIEINIPNVHGGPATYYTVEPEMFPGLSLDGVTGLISGRPSSLAALTSFIVTAWNSGGSSSVMLHAQVVSVPPANLAYSSPNATYSRRELIEPNYPSNSGGLIVSYSVSPALPTGLSMDSITGIISGTPISAVHAFQFTVTGTNSGGSTTCELELSVLLGDVVVGLPCELAPASVAIMQAYFDASASGGVRMRAEPDACRLYHLAGPTGVVDVILADALQTFLGWTKFDLQVAAVAVVDEASSHAAVIQPLVRASAGFTSFAQLRNARVCGGQLLSPGMYMSARYGLTHAGSDMAAPALEYLQHEVDSCRSPLRATLEAFFGLSCAPPVDDGEVGMCGICPSLPDSFACDSGNRYFGAEGALRGLSEGVCEVALVSDMTFDRFCGPSRVPLPEWCLDASEFSTLTDLSNTNGLGVVPSESFLVANGRLSGAHTSLLATQLRGLNARRDLLLLLGIYGVELVNGPDGIGIVSDINTQAHLSQGVPPFLQAVLDVPGVEQAIACAANQSCVAAPPETDCDNFSFDHGYDERMPLRIGLPARMSDAAKATLVNYLRVVLDLANVVVVGVEANSLRELWEGEVDIILADAAAAAVGSVLYGLDVLAVETTRSGPTNTQYFTSAWVLNNSEFHTFADVQDQRACHGALLSSAGVFLPLAWALTDDSEDSAAFRSLVRLASNAAPDAPMIGCSSGAAESIKSYFYANCAVGNSAWLEGVCDLCSTDGACDDTNRFGGSLGALRGLSERACEVAFARDDVWELGCNESDLFACRDGDKETWCQSRDSYRQLTNPTMISPSQAFLIRPQGLSPTVMGHAYDMLITMNHYPELLRALDLFGTTGVSGNHDSEFGNANATTTHLGEFMDLLSSANVPGWNTLKTSCVGGGCLSAHRDLNCTQSNEQTKKFWLDHRDEITSSATRVQTVAWILLLNLWWRAL